MDFKHKQKGDIAIHGAHGHAIEGADESLGREIAVLLSQHYLGYGWHVHLDSEGCVINIKCEQVSMEYGIRLKMKERLPNGTWFTRTHEELRQGAVMAGGELLERAKLKRGKRQDGKEADFVDGINKLQYQPAVRRNIHKYAELLNAPGPAKKH